MSTPFVKVRHDIGILRSDGSTKVGFMLARKGDVPVYEEYDDEYLAEQRFMGEPGYSALPPEKELSFRQDDFRGGFGLEIYDPSELKRYFYGINADARFRYQVRMGPLAATVTLPDNVTVAALTLANKDMEGTGDWTNGQRVTTQFHGGSYSWEVSATQAYQDCSNWNTAYQSKTVTCGSWIHAAAASRGRIGINDAVGTTWSSYHTGGSAWEYLTVSRTLNAAATRARILLDNDGGVGNTYFDDCYIGSPKAGAMTAGCDFNSARYQSYGQILMKQNAGGTGYDLVWCFDDNITDLCAGNVSGADYLIVCLGWSNNYFYMTAGEVFTDIVNAITGTAIKYMVMDGLTFRGSDSNSTIKATTNPLNGGTNWGTNYQIGEDAYNIVDLKMFKSLIYIKKSDSTAYYLSAAATPAIEVLVSGKANLGGDNSPRMFVWREEALLIPYGEQSLLEYDGTNITHIEPAAFIGGDISNFNGQIQAVTGDDQYAYIVTDNGTKVEVLAGRWEVVDASNDWRWHPLAELTLTGCASADISSIYAKRLWVGSSASADSFYYYPVTTKYGSIEDDANYKYQTGGEFYVPALHGNFKGDNKAFTALTVYQETTSTGVYWEAHFKEQGDTGWTSLGNFKTAPAATAYFPANSSNKWVWLKFVGITDLNTLSPKLLGYDLRAILYPARRTLIYCQIRAGSQILDKEGRELDADAATVKTVLDEAKNATWPLSFYDIDGTTRTVKVLPPPAGMPRRVVVKAEKNRAKEWLYNLLLQEVTLA